MEQPKTVESVNSFKLDIEFIRGTWFNSARWRGDRAAEGAALEMLCMRNRTEGSNPSLSAKLDARDST